MKIKESFAATIIGLLVMNTGNAEVKQHQSADPVKRDGVSATINRPSVEKNAVKYKKDQLRCWQDGDLIVVENNWKLKDTSQAMMTKGRQALYSYNFGETFCIYIED